jgi:hypothetical protein
MLTLFWQIICFLSTSNSGSLKQICDKCYHEFIPQSFYKHLFIPTTKNWTPTLKFLGPPLISIMHMSLIWTKWRSKNCGKYVLISNQIAETERHDLIDKMILFLDPNQIAEMKDNLTSVRAMGGKRNTRTRMKNTCMKCRRVYSSTICDWFMYT